MFPYVIEIRRKSNDKLVHKVYEDSRAAAEARKAMIEKVMNPELYCKILSPE